MTPCSVRLVDAPGRVRTVSPSLRVEAHALEQERRSDRRSHRGARARSVVRHRSAVIVRSSRRQVTCQSPSGVHLGDKRRRSPPAATASAREDTPELAVDRLHVRVHGVEGEEQLVGRSRARIGRWPAAAGRCSSRSLSSPAALARRRPIRAARLAAASRAGQHARVRGSPRASCLRLGEARSARARSPPRRRRARARSARRRGRAAAPHSRRRNTPCSSAASASSRRPCAASATPCAVCTSPTSTRLQQARARAPARPPRRASRSCSARLAAHGRRCSERSAIAPGRRRSTGRRPGRGAVVSVSQCSASVELAVAVVAPSRAPR